MPTFAVTYRYLPDTAETRDKVRPRHVEFLRGLLDAGALRVSGPTGDDSAPGALLVVEAVDAAEVAALFDSDPFHEAGVLERAIVEWRVFFGKDRVAS